MVGDHQRMMFDLEYTRTRARSSDVETSHDAAEQHERSGKAGHNRSLVLQAVREHSGMTAAELGQITGLGHIETQRRLSDLKNDNLVAMWPARKCSVNGTNMRTWGLF